MVARAAHRPHATPSSLDPGQGERLWTRSRTSSPSTRRTTPVKGFSLNFLTWGSAGRWLSRRARLVRSGQGVQLRRIVPGYVSAMTTRCTSERSACAVATGSIPALVHGGAFIALRVRQLLGGTGDDIRCRRSRATKYEDDDGDGAPATPASRRSEGWTIRLYQQTTCTSASGGDRDANGSYGIRARRRQQGLGDVRDLPIVEEDERSPSGSRAARRRSAIRGARTARAPAPYHVGHDFGNYRPARSKV